MTPRTGDPATAAVGLLDAVHQLEAAEAEYRPPAAGTVENLVAAAVVVVLGAATVVGAVDLGVGTAARPGPGTWPLLVGIALLVLGLALAAACRRTHDAERFTRSALLVAVALATMVVFVTVIESIGFEIPSALLAFVWLKVLGHESWRLSVVTSVAVVVAFYVLFVGLLAVPIPHLF